jgi:glutathione S-transferase
MRLYYSPGASSLSPHIALREAERAFDLERVDLKTHRTMSGHDFREINPKGYVPALQLDPYGEEVLTEGAAILQYIADLVPEKRLAPSNGTFLRYHLQEWLSFIATEIDQPFMWLFAPDTPAHTQARARGRIGERLTYVNGLFVDRGFAMGETFTVVDCYLFAMLRNCERFDIDRLVWPNVQSYYERLFVRPTVQASLAAEGLLENHHHRVRRSA